MFKNAKVGDRVWFFEYGWGTIVNMFYGNEYPIVFKSDTNKFCNFMIDGKRVINDINPSLFWNEIKFTIPEKPFDLETELRKLEIKEFCCGEENFHLYWDNEEQEIYIRIAEIFEEPLCVYFDEESVINFQESIKDKKITKEEFFTAYKNVFGGKNAD